MNSKNRNETNYYIGWRGNGREESAVTYFRTEIACSLVGLFHVDAFGPYSKLLTNKSISFRKCCHHLNGVRGSLHVKQQ
jgi:hypothetical protein